MSINKAKIGVEDIEFGSSTFNRKGRTGFNIAMSRVNASHIPILDSAGSFTATEVEAALAEIIATLVANGIAIVPVSSLVVNGLLTARRIRTTGGTTLVSGDIALSAGWGSTASVLSIAGTDQRFSLTVQSAGVGQAANPTITVTYKDGAWPAIPRSLVVRNDNYAYQPTVLPKWNNTTTTVEIVFLGTPVAGETYQYEVLTLGM